MNNLSRENKQKLIEISTRLNAAIEYAEEAGRIFAEKENQGGGKPFNHSYSLGVLEAEVSYLSKELEILVKYL